MIMIRSFKHKGLEKFFKKGTASGIQSVHSKRLRLILGRLNASAMVQDMDLPGLYLHQLRGKYRGRWSVRNPPHPGEVIRDLCLEPLGLTVTDAANALGVSRKTLSSILNGRSGISPEMALRLSKAFSTTPESWLNQQVQYDLWNAKKHSKGIKVKKLYAA
jgi:addiction module HigA family antidote